MRRGAARTANSRRRLVTRATSRLDAFAQSDQPHQRDRAVSTRPAVVEDVADHVGLARSIIPHVALSSWYELCQIGNMGRLLIARSSAAATQWIHAVVQPGNGGVEERPFAA